jgi:hypothetical protein
MNLVAYFLFLYSALLLVTCMDAEERGTPPAARKVDTAAADTCRVPVCYPDSRPPGPPR